MPFNTALSGIRAANADLKVTGNNIANASTVGFKSSRTEFGDVYASSILGGGGNTIGGGVRVQDVAQQFSQGNISFTENELDLAIGGSGFFVVQQGGDQLYTRAGTFGLDSDGYIVNNTNARLQGFAADAQGNVGGVLGDMQIETGNQPPRLTTLVESGLNLNANESVLQRSGTSFSTDGNAIGLALSGPLLDTTSNVLASSLSLPMANDFTVTPMSFEVTLASATANNGTVNVTLDSANGMPSSINTFNDLRTVAGVINGQLFSPNSSTQSPIDVLAVAVNDGGGAYHLEFQALISGESSQVSVSNGNASSVAVSDPAARAFATTGAINTSAEDPSTIATIQGRGSLLNDTPQLYTAADFVPGDTVAMTVNGTPASLDFSTAPGMGAATDTDGVVTAINAMLLATFGTNTPSGTPVIEAFSSNPGAGFSGVINFDTGDTGSDQSISITATSGANPLGLSPLSDQGSDAASFDIAVNGASSVRVSIGDLGPQTNRASFQASLDAALDAAIPGASDLVDVLVDPASGRVSFESTSAGANNTIQITQVNGVDILGLDTGVPSLLNEVYRGGDSAASMGLPVAGGSISDSSGEAAASNGYPVQAIDVTGPDGETVTFTSLEGGSAAETASNMNGLSGVTATATTTATITGFTNGDTQAVITLNNVGLRGDNLQELAVEINALTTSTLPGVSAVHDDLAGTLVVTSGIGDDLVFQFSSSFDGDQLVVQGVAGTEPVTLEADPAGDGTFTATNIATPSTSTPMAGSENYWGLVPAPGFDISIDGGGFQTVNLQGINSDLLINGTTPAAGILASSALAAGAMNTTFDLTVTNAGVGTETVSVDLGPYVTGGAGSPAALQGEIQAAVNAALVAQGASQASSTGTVPALDDTAIDLIAGGGANTVTLDVNGSIAVIDLEAAATAADLAGVGTATTDLLAAEINTLIAASGLAGLVTASNPTTPADGAIRFTTVTGGTAQVLTVTSDATDSLGYAIPTNVLGAGATAASSAGAVGPLADAEIDAIAAGANSVTLDINGTPAVIDLAVAAAAANVAGGGTATTDLLVAEINTLIGLSPLAGQITATNPATPGDGGIIFSAVTPGATQVLTVTPDASDALGYSAPANVLGVDDGPLVAGDVTVNLNPVTNELSFSVTDASANIADTILLDNIAGQDDLGLIALNTAMGGDGLGNGGVAQLGAAPSILATQAAIQQAMDDTVGAGVINVELDSNSQIFFETALPGSDHSLRIANVVGNDVLGFASVPNLVGSLFEGVDGDNVRAEGTNGNGNSIRVGGEIDLVLDEGYSVSNTVPLAAGLFSPFAPDTFEPFTINEFNPLDQGTYNHATSVPVYDSLGGEHIMTQYFVKQTFDSEDPTTRQNHWQMHVLIDGQNVGDPNTTLTPPENTVATRATYNLSFNNDGTLNSLLSDDILISNWQPMDADGNPLGSEGPQTGLNGGALPIPQPPLSSNFEIDMAGTTQHSGDFSVDNVDQDGFATGRLSGIDIDDSGIIFARFTNGEAQALGQIALAEFPNMQGLQPSGNTMWAENFETGTPSVGTPGTASFGVITAGALEDSNVDLSEELVNLIIAQRNFQASSKTIETANQVTQTIINLR